MILLLLYLKREGKVHAVVIVIFKERGNHTLLLFYLKGGKSARYCFI